MEKQLIEFGCHLGGWLGSVEGWNECIRLGGDHQKGRGSFGV